MIYIETERLILRPFTIQDLNDFYTYAKVPGVGEMAGWPHHSCIDDSRTILERFVGDAWMSAIVHKQDQKVIGSIGLHQSWMEEDARYIEYGAKEIGYVLSKDYWGQGLMPEAVRAICAYCFEMLRLDAVTICHADRNERSRAVIQKCGFVFSHEFLNTTQLADNLPSRAYYLLREDWEK